MYNYRQRKNTSAVNATHTSEERFELAGG